MNPILAKKHSGVSMIELLVSLALGMILLLGVVEVFVNSKKTYRVQDALSEMQENARFAVDILLKDLRLAGYLGCGNLNRIEPEVITGLTNYRQASVVQGFQNNGNLSWAPTPPSELTTSTTVNEITAGPDSDLIAVMSAGACSAQIQSDMASASANIAIAASNDCGFANNDIVMVSDCASADVFQITSAPSGGLLSHADLQKPYDTSAEVMTVKSVTYFAGTDPDSQIPSLFMFNNSEARGVNNPVALIEGVESLQILFGEDTTLNGVPDVFQDADDVTAWENVVSARITLLMRSTSPVGADQFEDPITNVIYNDGILRKTFVSTVQLRNRG